MKDDPLASNAGESTEQPAQAVAEAPSPHDPLRELRLAVYGLAVFVFLSSLSLNLFIYKQNKKMQMETGLLKQQAQAIEQNQVFQQNRGAIENLLREVANQTPAHPEAAQILARYNIRVEQQAAAASQVPAVPPLPQK